MPYAQEILERHPRRPERDMQLIVAATEEVAACADVCRTCADACLAEDRVQELVRCIRLNLDCADICTATGAVLTRMTEPSGGLLRAQLQACITACRVCGEECARHADMHEHCRVCASHCASCAQACEELLATFPG